MTTIELVHAEIAFCKAVCDGNPPRETCIALGRCKEYECFIRELSKNHELEN